ncbi:unnamed protein product [Allacma fusca]|uniref:Carboxylic ester hydrolase n=1 Tax=Allacma fusca TaxID=39272 RepID=A0A8J2K132_9HEXA|nr:unnamed protein product [Allacma fusca]
MKKIEHLQLEKAQATLSKRKATNRMTTFLVPSVSYIYRCTINFNPKLRIPDGVLMGETGKSRGGRDFYKFWCIPYGKQERFEPSEPADPWEGILDATECDKTCVQTGMADMGMTFSMGTDTEDCLILNVFIPAGMDPRVGLLPVMFYIHGGYFHLGSGLHYSGELLLDENIVYVSINYRLGAFGFLTSGDGILESNLGLKDMILALEWVQKNIRFFGGDPNRVTIFGESAGSGAVGFLVLSPLAKGLFNYAIGMSGTTMSPWSYQSFPQDTFLKYVTEINCTAPTTEESVLCLKNKTAEELVAICQKTKWFVELVHPLFPAIEWIPPRKSKIFLPDHPRRMLAEGNFNYVPYMTGVCEDEGAFQGVLVVNDEDFIHDVNYKWNIVGGTAIGVDYRNISKANLNKGLRKLRRYYFDDEDVSPVLVQNLTDMFSDAWFIHSMDYAARHHAKHAPMYIYVFVKKGAMRFSEFIAGKTLNRSVVSHGEDLQYMFFKGFTTSLKDETFSTRYIKLWVSFAYDGKPTGTWGPDKTWPTVPPDMMDYPVYLLDDEPRVVPNPFKDRAAMWEDLISNEWNEMAYQEGFS